MVYGGEPVRCLSTDVLRVADLSFAISCVAASVSGVGVQVHAAVRIGSDGRGPPWSTGPESAPARAKRVGRADQVPTLAGSRQRTERRSAALAPGRLATGPSRSHPAGFPRHRPASADRGRWTPAWGPCAAIDVRSEGRTGPGPGSKTTGQRRRAVTRCLDPEKVGTSGSSLPRVVRGPGRERGEPVGEPTRTPAPKVDVEAGWASAHLGNDR